MVGDFRTGRAAVLKRTLQSDLWLLLASFAVVSSAIWPLGGASVLQTVLVSVLWPLNAALELIALPGWQPIVLSAPVPEFVLLAVAAWQGAASLPAALTRLCIAAPVLQGRAFIDRLPRLKACAGAWAFIALSVLVMRSTALQGGPNTDPSPWLAGLFAEEAWFVWAGLFVGFPVFVMVGAWPMPLSAFDSSRRPAVKRRRPSRPEVSR